MPLRRGEHPGQQADHPEHLLTLAPDVCGHINGGPTSLDRDGVDTIMDETGMALQLVQAGNLKSAVRILERAARQDALSRIVIGSDTPTGTGVMPLGVIKTVAELASLTGIDSAIVWAAASGNNARTWNLPAGLVTEGRAGDLVVMDAPWGSTRGNARDALAVGDIPGISAVITSGQVRALKSRNTPASARGASVEPQIPHLESSAH